VEATNEKIVKQPTLSTHPQPFEFAYVRVSESMSLFKRYCSSIGSATTVSDSADQILKHEPAFRRKLKVFDLRMLAEKSGIELRRKKMSKDELVDLLIDNPVE
jgi:hypothetical protein